MQLQYYSAIINDICKDILIRLKLGTGSAKVGNCSAICPQFSPCNGPITNHSNSIIIINYCGF